MNQGQILAIRAQVSGGDPLGPYPPIPFYTFANLPAASAANNGQYAIVVDGNTVTNGSPPTGGGSTTVLVLSTGAAWNCQ